MRTGWRWAVDTTHVPGAWAAVSVTILGAEWSLMGPDLPGWPESAWQGLSGEVQVLT